MDLTPLFKIYANYQINKANKADPVEQQKKTLLKLINLARNTKFAQDHHFSSDQQEIVSVEQYQKLVKLRYYEDFWEEYWQESFPVTHNLTHPGKVNHFAVTSGTTTGATKYIPLTKEMENSNTRSGLKLLAYHVQNYPNSKLLSGKSFFLGGSTNLVKETEGIFSGDLSGIVNKNLAWFARPFYFPPPELSTIADWEEKIERFAIECTKEKITLISGVPSWMLIFFNRMFELHPEAEGKLINIFPDLEVIVHGGVNFAPYQKQFEKLTEGSNIQFREVYPASEGFIAIADRNYGEGLRLNLDNDLFYEFIPLDKLDQENPPRYWLDNVETDVNYAIALTTCSGLWSYIIGDTVKFVDTKQPRVLITGRTAYSLSAFGEHLIEAEIQNALTTASNQINYDINDFSVGAVFPEHPEDLGGHVYVVEFNGEIPDTNTLDKFASIIDETLCAENEDYAAHRAEGFGLNPPQIMPVPANTFKAWMESRGKLGGQNKVPRIIKDQELLNNLLHFTDNLT